MELNNTDIIILRNDIELREYPQGKTLLSFATSQAFEINQTAWRMLELLKQPSSMDVLLNQLAKEFNTTVDEISDDAKAFLGDCIKLGMVVTHPAQQRELGV